MGFNIEVGTVLVGVEAEVGAKAVVTGEQRHFPSKAASFIMNHRVEALVAA